MARERIASIAQQHQFCAELKTNLSYCYGSSASANGGTTATASTVSMSSIPLPATGGAGDLETVEETDLANDTAEGCVEEVTVEGTLNNAEEHSENGVKTPKDDGEDGERSGNGGGGVHHLAQQPFCPVYVINGE